MLKRLERYGLKTWQMALIAVLLLIFSAIKFILISTNLTGQHTDVLPKQEAICKDLSQLCTLESMTLWTDRPIKHGEKFQLFVAHAQKPKHLTFKMVGMEMPPTRYSFLPARSGVWVAEVILPICVTGRRDWFLQFEHEKTSVEVHFEAL